MTWAKLDDGFPDHPIIRSLSDQAFRLHVSAVCYCCRYLTDGKVPSGFVDPRQRKTAAELVEAGRWIVEAGGWSIHDFLQYQESRERVEARRAKTKERVERHRNGVTAPVTNAKGNGATNGAPDPTRTTYISSPSGRDRPGEPNPSVSYAKADADWRARAAREPNRDEAKAAAPDGLAAARARLKAVSE